MDRLGRGPRRRHLGGWLGSLLVAGLLPSGGCQGTTVRLTAQQQVRLGQRAMMLLAHAAQSDLNAVARANAIEALVDLAPEENLPIFRAAVASDVPLVRYAGCVALGEARDVTSLKGIQRLRNDPDARIRLAAAFAAYRCGDMNAGRELVATLNDHPDEKVRADAAYLIGELGEPKALKRLRIALGRESSGYVVVHIESAMAKLGDEDRLDKLVRYALKSDAVTVLLALQTLVELAEAETRGTLEYRLHSEADYLQTRLIAARGLGRLGVNEGYDLARASLTQSGQDDNETMQIRANAALALGAIGEPRALWALQRLVESENDPRTQVAACYAICQIFKASAPD
jgi:HEAT repeat protein